VASKWCQVISPAVAMGSGACSGRLTGKELMSITWYRLLSLPAAAPADTDSSVNTALIAMVSNWPGHDALQHDSHTWHRAQQVVVEELQAQLVLKLPRQAPEHEQIAVRGLR
jgi:hypothetical protein